MKKPPSAKKELPISLKFLHSTFCLIHAHRRASDRPQGWTCEACDLEIGRRKPTASTPPLDEQVVEFILKQDQVNRRPSDLRLIGRVRCS